MSAGGQESLFPLLVEAHLPRISQLVEERLGLHFADGRQSDLKRGVIAAAESSTKPQAWLERLCRGEWTSSHAELLSIHLTIGETYFFRDPEVFQALAHRIVPEMAGRKERIGERQIRVWCAGCSSGEEPYSLAMVLDEALPEGWNADILATDINALALARARKGSYADWSFRGSGRSCRWRFFKAARNHRWRLDAAIRQRVRFATLNLADPVYPSALNGTAQIDLILCRNVLMYLSHGLAAEVVQRFRRALTPWGRLIVSPAEASPDLLRGFSLEMVDGALCYRLEKPPEGERTRNPGSLKAGRSLLPVDQSEPSLPQPMARMTAEGLHAFPEPFRFCDPVLRQDAAGAALYHLRTALQSADHRTRKGRKERGLHRTSPVSARQIVPKQRAWPRAGSHSAASCFTQPLELFPVGKDNETPCLLLGQRAEHSIPIYSSPLSSLS